MCITRPAPVPPLFGLGGFQVMNVFGVYPGVAYLSVWISGVALLALAYRTACSARARKLPQFSELRVFASLYCLITGIFFFALMTELNKLVVVLAGLHNLIEWGMLTAATIKHPSNLTAFACCVVWIWIVWLVVLEMHDPLAAFIFEEVTGIWPDFMLLITSWYLFATAKTATSNDVRTKTVYFNWGLGASWHMIQIWTLLGQGFGFLPPAWALGLTFGTALPNYYYYSQFALAYDGDESKPPLPLPAGGEYWKDFKAKCKKEAENWQLTFGGDAPATPAQPAPSAPAQLLPGSFGVANPAVGAIASDDAKAGPSGTSMTDPEKGAPSAGGALAPAPASASAPPALTPSLQNQHSEDKDAGKFYKVGRGRVEKSQPCKYFGWCMPVALLLAAIFVLGPILIAGRCSDAGLPCPDTSGAVWTISVVSSTNASQEAVQTLLANQIESTRSTRGNLYHSVFVGGYQSMVRGESAPNHIGDFLMVNKWDSYQTFSAAQSILTAVSTNPNVAHMDTWDPFQQWEGTGDYANIDCTIVDFSQPATSNTNAGNPSWCPNTSPAGITLVSANPANIVGSIYTVTRGLASRKNDDGDANPANKFYHVLTGGANFNGAADDPFKSVGKLAVLEQWASVEAFRDHLDPNIPEGEIAKKMAEWAGTLALPGGVQAASPFYELVPCA